MKILITGSGGLIGSEASRYFLKNHKVFGIDNNTRQVLFGPAGSVLTNIENLNKFSNYTHLSVDIRNRGEILSIFKRYKPDVIIHCAAQPSHDKAASIPFDDFDINATGTINLLESCRLHCKDAVFINMSTNKVYGDTPNKLNLIESEKRYDFADEKYINGINETLSIDNCLHSLFGASKVSSDIIAQEYGKYFGMNVGVFRGGCLTGPQHAGVELHGFLSYIVKCALSDKPYTIFGYKGKQVRDQIHSYDVIKAFECFIENPRQGEVYNIGGCKENSSSILEIIDLLERLAGKRLNYVLTNDNRIGDHICYYSDMSKFKTHYNNWSLTYNLTDIIQEIYEC
jgi:CDP-paratose 2-epimerase